MRFIAVSYLRDFWDRNLDAEQPLKSGVDEVKGYVQNMAGNGRAQSRRHCHAAGWISLHQRAPYIL